MAENSYVVCKGKRISYGDIVAKGDLTRTYSDEQLASLPIKAPNERKLVGMQTVANDIPAKTDGSAVYGIDATYPGWFMPSQ